MVWVPDHGSCDGSCDGLVMKSIDNKELRVVDTHFLDYENSTQPKTVTLHLMLGVSDWNKCGELMATCDCSPCKELRVDLENINDELSEFNDYAAKMKEVEVDVDL